MIRITQKSLDCLLSVVGGIKTFMANSLNFRHHPVMVVNAFIIESGTL